MTYFPPKRFELSKGYKINSTNTKDESLLKPIIQKLRPKLKLKRESVIDVP